MARLAPPGDGRAKVGHAGISAILAGDLTAAIQAS
jgi:hypothetical protein